ncbi:hypothetical protein FA13DRAFT_1728581 [Coprinellus micaceus]|uniref:CASTOR ACT domain-containing protein n=1 Tax=Coprinellus micaceus TaxID=71717 RepID=A0A4Y7TP38_COPMI|nr:hypothetical protein FA13DRAFT_1728581 [Coprinellus micaceus]
MQVTISLLPVSLSLIHIPRTRLPALTTAIIRQLLLPQPQFLNITANDIELSIFAEEHVLHDFLPIARRDRHQRRHHALEVSYEKWSVLQIDSHSDQAVDNAGARVHELSAPLAAAGISILYQSSYMSDFMFVKESQLQQVLRILAAHGFDLLSSEATTATASPTVTTHPQSLAGGPTDEPAPARSKSHSPASSDVRILAPDLACVGLSDEFGVDNWGLKIVKLVAFPDLIPGTSTSSQNSSTTDCSSLASDDDGYFSYSPQSTSPSSEYPSRSHSFDDLHSPISPPSKSASKHSYTNPYMRSPSRRSTYPSKHSEYTTSSSHQFFSFTRTPEGSSLTADVCVLATLFPPNERHMVICGGELAAADERIASGMTDYASDTEDDGEGIGDSSMLKCLQLDLRKFGLDKHGLVNRFSRVLEQNGINHMYSSTFKTANLLVDKKQALRAQSLLRLC